MPEYLQPASLLVLCGPEGDVSSWQETLRTRYLPEMMIFALTANVSGLPEALNKPVTAQATAWLCQGTQCLPPITSVDELSVTLQTTSLFSVSG